MTKLGCWRQVALVTVFGTAVVTIGCPVPFPYIKETVQPLELPTPGVTHRIDFHPIKPYQITLDDRLTLYKYWFDTTGGVCVAFIVAPMPPGGFYTCNLKEKTRQVLLLVEFDEQGRVREFTRHQRNCDSEPLCQTEMSLCDMVERWDENPRREELYKAYCRLPGTVVTLYVGQEVMAQIEEARRLAVETEAWVAAAEAKKRQEEAIKRDQALEANRPAVEAKALRGDVDMAWWLYEHGRAEEEKMLWLCHAAHGGHADARYRVAARYGISTDRVHAYLWYTLAARAGSREARRQIKRVRAGLTHEQLAEANRLVRDWKPAPESCAAEAQAIKEGR